MINHKGIKLTVINGKVIPYQYNCNCYIEMYEDVANNGTTVEYALFVKGKLKSVHRTLVDALDVLALSLNTRVEEPA
jgi:hypothetical protein